MLLVFVVVTVLTLALSPFVLPWTWKVHWVIAAEATNPLIAASVARHHTRLDEVTVVGLRRRPHTITIDVEIDAWRDREHMELVGPAPSVGDLAALEGWLCVGTPLLLEDEDGNAAILRGPDRTITGLHEADHDRVVRGNG